MVFLKNKKIKIVFDKSLPANIIIPESGNHLYLIGCAYYNPGKITKRYRWHNPKFFIFTIIFLLVRSFVFLYLPSKYDQFLIWFGDNAVIMKQKFHFTLQLITFDYIILLTHLSHYLVWLKLKHFNQTPNNAPFDLVAGRISPKNVDLFNKKAILKLVLFQKLSIYWAQICSRYIATSVVGTFYYLIYVPKMIQMNSWAIWPVTFCWMAQIEIKNYHFFSIFIYHAVYFSIVCFYLNLKFHQIKKIIFKLKKKTNKTTFYSGIYFSDPSEPFVA